MMNNLSTVIIPVAGKGTRFLPVTKTLNKTMFPVINKPVLQYLLEEAVTAGFKNVILVINEDQLIIKDYFNLESKYYYNLNKSYEGLEELNTLLNKINIIYVIQSEPLGLGDAIKICEKYILDEAFGVILGDDLVLSNNEHYGIYNLIEKYQKNKSNYVGIKEVPQKETNKYGIVEYDNKNKIINIVEKPKDNPPSNMAAVGRYVLKKSIFKYLKEIKPENGKELQLTDAIMISAIKEEVYGVDFNGVRFDIGDYAGYVNANIYASINKDESKDKVIEFIKQYLLY